MTGTGRSRSPGCQSSAGSAAFLVGLEGEVAARAGHPVSANPYETGTMDRLEWLGGWMRAAPGHASPIDEA